MTVIRVLVSVLAFFHFGGSQFLPKPLHFAIAARLMSHVNSSNTIVAAETICAVFVLVGFLTRVATLPLLIAALLAIMSNKLPHLNAHDILYFHSADADRYGAWSIIHDVRADFVILFGSVFILYEGAGWFSLDRWIVSRRAFRRRPARVRSRRSKATADF